MSKKALIVLIIDHDVYQEEDHRGLPLDNESLMSFGEEANDMAAHWLGYEAWIVVPDAPKPLLNQLGKLNHPIKPGPQESR